MTDGLTDATDGLTEAELEMLDLERGWFKTGGGKAGEIRRRFGWSHTRYSQALNALLDRPEAEAADPMLVRRLRRLRSARRAARTPYIGNVTG